jgi:glycosyltransferase involved in cell wall biosynthesis
MNSEASSCPIPLITVITVVRNDPVGLRRTLQSFGSDVNFEHVIVDGSDSPVSCRSVLDQFDAPRGGRVVVAELDNGPYHAMNKGIIAARGSWIWFLNAGDEVSAELDLSALETLLQNVAPHVPWAVGAVAVAGGRAPFKNEAVLDPQLIRRGRASQCHQGMFVRRQSIADVGLFNTRLKIAADYQMMYDLASVSAPAAVSQTVALFYRGGLSTHNRRRIMTENWLVRVRRWDAPFWWHLLDTLRTIKRCARPGVVDLAEEVGP